MRKINMECAQQPVHLNLGDLKKLPKMFNGMDEVIEKCKEKFC